MTRLAPFWLAAGALFLLAAVALLLAAARATSGGA